MDKIHQQNVQAELKEIEEKGGKGKDNMSIPEAKLPLKTLQDLENEKMAFQGDFEDVDNEIKCQVKALISNDFVTMKKIQNNEMNKNDVQFYLADDFKKKELLD